MSRFKNNHSTETCSGSEAGSYLRLIDSSITQLKAQGPSRTCNESKEKKKYRVRRLAGGLFGALDEPTSHHIGEPN